jgi:hypothetical protein
MPATIQECQQPSHTEPEATLQSSLLRAPEMSGTRDIAVRNLRRVSTRPFDPASRGARRLARDWLAHLERWEMRVPIGHIFTEGDGTMIESGRRIEVSASEGEQLVECGYKLIRIRRARPHD